MNPKYSKSFVYSYVTCTGASVMALELAASRFLAPYFGTSMLIWANIIGLILLCLSLGYLVGGRIADKRPSAKLLMQLSLAAGVWMSLVPVWGKLIFTMMSGGILNTPIVTIVLCLLAIILVFAPPVFLLAMVSPFALCIVDGEKHDIGKLAGNLYAFSTLGSLVGTFGTAFGTIPFWGTRETLFFWAAVLILVSVWGLWRTRLVYVASACILVPSAGYAALHGPVKTGDNVVFAKDSLYQYVQVTKDEDGTYMLVYNEGGGVQSMRRPKDALSTGDYYDDYLALPYLTSSTWRNGEAQPQGSEAASRVLVLGSAGGTIPHLLNHYDKQAFPNLQVTGVEIDPDVIPLDYQYFGLQTGEATLVNQDARAFMRQSATKPALDKYDAIVVDAYTQQIYIPFHLSTVEFFTQVKQRLNPQGVMALNVNAVSENSKLLLSIEKTVQAAFPYAYVMKARGEYNYIVVGSLQPLQLGRLQAIPFSSPLAAIAEEWAFQVHPIPREARESGELLTDNKAPLEMLTDSMIFGFAEKRNQ